MSYWILPPSGIPISCNTVQRLTNLEQQTDTWKRRMDTFDDELEAKFQTSSSDVSNSTRDIPQNLLLDLDGEDEDFMQEFNGVIDDDDNPHHDDTKDDAQDGEVGVQDPYLNMELGLPHGDEAEDLRLARVKRRAVDVEGRPVGRPSDNPVLDSRQYEVEFLDGKMEILTASIIAENLLAQVDEEGHRQMMIAEIEDHRVLDDAIPANDGYFTTTWCCLLLDSNADKKSQVDVVTTFCCV
jgi:hypothetical protein